MHKAGPRNTIYEPLHTDKSKSSGFTLIEVLVAVLIFTMGAGAAFALATMTISSGSSAKSQFIASYLAQEGVEIVRNIRDSNFLAIRKTGSGIWNQGLEGCEASGAGCEAVYGDASLAQIGGTPGRLYRDSQAVHTYDTGGTETLFTRVISVDQAGDELQIRVVVSWQEGSNQRQVTDETLLYNWLTPS